MAETFPVEMVTVGVERKSSSISKSNDLKKDEAHLLLRTELSRYVGYPTNGGSISLMLNLSHYLGDLSNLECQKH